MNIRLGMPSISMEAWGALVLIKVVFWLLFLFSDFGLAQDSLSSYLEKSALYELRSSLGISAKEWPKKADPCLNWTGIQCLSGRVKGIKLSGLRRTRVGNLNPRFAVNALANFSLIVSFNASGFQLPGPIAQWFGRRLNALQVLDLSSCSVTGPIPPSLGSLSQLNVLILSDNLIAGIVPATLGKLKSLSVLDLKYNRLSGLIPSAFSALGNLTSLDLSSNFLSGPIPSGLGSLSKLQFLNLGNNSLTATIPSQLCYLSQLIKLDLGLNFLSGSLPEGLSQLTNLHKIVLTHNGLDGPLRSSFFLNLTQLLYVDLSWNHFDGDFSDSVWSLSQLYFFDISNNNLTGMFSKVTAALNVTGALFNFSNNLFYGDLTSLVGNFSSIDLTGNYLQGLPPNVSRASIEMTRNCFQGVPNQRSLEDCGMFYTEKGLSFIESSPPDSMLPLGPKPRKRKKQLTYIMVGLFGGLGFLVILTLVLVLLLKFCRKKYQLGIENMGSGPLGDSIISSLSGLGESFTHEQMLKATGDFSGANLIKHGHSGDLFRGTLEGGFPVVVKRVDLHLLGNESYMSELDLFKKVRHPRLVPLLGHCLEQENEKFFVYKCMPKGDMSNFFYRFTDSDSDNLQSLDWITRLKIATGAAEGLDYLHQCNPPFVHRDIQASSVLLDDKYEARLGSLSEACAPDGHYNQNVITRLLRMPQTSEERSSGSSSTACAHDVYCFGKLLLELVTGKLGIGKSDDAATKERLENTLAFISTYEKELVTKIVDPSLIVNEDLLEEVWAVAIVAKSCLNPIPSKRPLMRHILRALENPFRVVRMVSHNSARLRTSSSMGSWNAAFFRSWRHSSSENVDILGQADTKGNSPETVGKSRVSGQ